MSSCTGASLQNTWDMERCRAHSTAGLITGRGVTPRREFSRAMPRARDMWRSSSTIDIYTPRVRQRATNAHAQQCGSRGKAGRYNSNNAIIALHGRCTPSTRQADARKEALAGGEREGVVEQKTLLFLRLVRALCQEAPLATRHVKNAREKQIGGRPRAANAYAPVARIVSRT